MKLNFSDEIFPGILISFCGIDGSGKTTQIEMLSSWFKQKGYRLTKTFQPTKEVRESALFRQFVDSGEHDGLEYRSLSLITISDRLQHSRHFILPKLMNSEIVLTDRYYYSALANLWARGYKNDKWIYEIAGFIPKPDIAFFMDTDFDVSLQRVRNRPNEKERFIDVEFDNELCRNMKQIGKESNGVFLDGEDTIENIHEAVVLHVNHALSRKLVNITH